MLPASSQDKEEENIILHVCKCTVVYLSHLVLVLCLTNFQKFLFQISLGGGGGLLVYISE